MQLPARAVTTVAMQLPAKAVRVVTTAAMLLPVRAVRAVTTVTTAALLLPVRAVRAVTMLLPVRAVVEVQLSSCWVRTMQCRCSRAQRWRSKSMMSSHSQKSRRYRPHLLASCGRKS